jgi:hypothetical protein
MKNTQSNHRRQKKIYFFLQFFFFFLLLSASAEAQWKKIGANVFGIFNTIDGYNGALTFKDGICFGGIYDLFLSLDSGKTWSHSFTSNGSTILSIDIYDSQNAAVQTGDGLYITTNQGATWVLNNVGGYDACYAGSASNIVAITNNWTIQVTTDGGNTWRMTYSVPVNTTLYSIKYRNNGFVVARDGTHLILSSDYGETWRAQRDTVVINDSWSFTFSPCDSSKDIFFAVENTHQFPFSGPQNMSSILITSDSGNSWRTSKNYPIYFVNGSITTFGSSLFFGTSSYSKPVNKTQGVFRSTNKGLTWDSLGGPSSWVPDSRFIAPINSNLILAADYLGNVWQTDNAGGFPVVSPPLTVNPPKPIVSNECGRDSTSLVMSALSCHRYHVTAASFRGADADLFRLSGNSLPIILSDGAKDSIEIVVDTKQRNGALRDSIKLTYYDEDDGVVRDTIIAVPVTVTPLPPNLQADAALLKLLQTPICVNLDSVILLRNVGCDTLQLISGPGTLANGITCDPLSFPIILPPDSILIVHIHFLRAVPGNFSALAHFIAEHKGLEQSVDVKIEGSALGLSAGLSAKDPLIIFDPVSLCVPNQDTIVYLKNLGCDTLRIISGPNGLSSNFTADAIMLPIVLAPGDLIAVHFHFTSSAAGIYRSQVNFTSVLQGSFLSTSIVLQGETISRFPGLKPKDSVLKFPPVSLCHPDADTIIKLANNGCDTLHIISGLGSLGANFSYDPIVFPIVLAPDSSFSVHFHFHSSARGVVNASADFISKEKSLVFTTTILLTGIGIGGDPGLTISDSILRFPTISICFPNADTIIPLINHGCDTLLITSGPGNLGNNFSCDPIVFPITLPPDSGVFLHFHFHPIIIGSFQANALFTAAADQVIQKLTITLTGSASSTISGPVVLQTSFVFDTVCETGRDTTITFTNRGCDTLTILSGPGTLAAGFSWDVLPLPIILPPKVSVTMTFHFLPVLSGKYVSYVKFITVRNGKQSSLDLFFEGYRSSDAGTLSYNPKQFDFKSLSICSHDTVTGSIFNGGCNALLFDPAQIFGSLDYSVTGLSGLSMVPKENISYTVYLDPVQKGLRKGILVLNSHGVTGRHDTIPFTCIVTDGTRILSASANALDFGTVNVCDVAKDTIVTLYNSGCDTLIITGYNISGAGFGISENFPDTILSGKSKQIKIITGLDTTGGKTFSIADLTFMSNADSLPSLLRPINLAVTYAASTKRNIGFYLDGNARAGLFPQTVIFDVKEMPGTTFTGTGIKQLQFDLGYNTDLLGFDTESSSTNLSSADGRHFIITDASEINASGGNIASIGFKFYLTKDSMTDIDLISATIDTVHLPCTTLAFSYSGTARFEYKFLCGDRAIQDFMNGILPLKIISIHPNPSQAEITVDLYSSMEQEAMIEIRNALGERVFSSTHNFSQGTNSLQLDTKNISCGVYWIRMGNTSQFFVKIK